MKAGLLTSVSVLIFGGMLFWLSFQRCEQACIKADVKAQSLFEDGQYMAVLLLVDKTDSHCGCSEYTSGDAPSQYALASISMDRLLADTAQYAQLKKLIQRTKSPVLNKLANDLAFE